MPEIVVYSARPERVLVAASHLQQHGVSSRIAPGSVMTFPWIVAGLPRHQLFVDTRVADRARDLLKGLQAVETDSALRLTRTVRWWLLLFASSTVGFIACGISSIDHDGYGWAAFACLIGIVVAGLRLRWTKPARNGVSAGR